MLKCSILLDLGIVVPPMTHLAKEIMLSYSTDSRSAVSISTTSVLVRSSLLFYWYPDFYPASQSSKVVALCLSMLGYTLGYSSS